MKYKPLDKEQTKAEEPDLAGYYSASDYLSWTFEGLVEIIRGKIHKMSPAPSSNHQRLVGRLHTELVSQLEGKGCEVWLSPFDVYLLKPGQYYKETHNVVEPDLCIICDPSKIKSFGCVGSPDFIIEILSPSTAKKDTGEKLQLYEEYGVKEYWIIDPAKKQVHIYTLDNENTYEKQNIQGVPGLLSPKEFSTIKIDTGVLFQGLPG